MALARTAFYYFFFFIWTLSLSAAAEEKNNGEKPGIPELPEREESTSIPEALKDAPSVTVVNFDESKQNFGFFRSDNGSNRAWNALDLDGYFRVRFNYFRNGSLLTYLPSQGYGTSMMLPSLSSLRDFKKEAGQNAEKDEINPAQNNFSGNMRLRVNPTINVSEVVRIKSSLDVFDNMVLGSTPAYLSNGARNPSWPSSLMSLSQNPPMYGVNSWQGAISVKRAWAEANFPIGELSFGRMPFHFGLGILYNKGDEITNDYGDQVDGIFFTTRLGNHFITPGYHIAYTGPAVRGGGFLDAKNAPAIYLASELGQRYPLETGDATHVLSLTLVKRDSDFMAAKKKEEGRPIFDYGLFTAYRSQFLDTQTYAYNDIKLDTQIERLVKRDGHVGMASLWTAFSFDTFHIELEAAGIFGRYKIGEVETGKKTTDDLASNNEGDPLGERKVWLLQGGVALKSKYGFLNDRLQVGLDSGWASSQDGAGFGIREGSNNNPKAGYADGRKLPSENNFKTNFKFNPAYTVDLLLYREILGGISGSFYFKPHITYLFSRNFGIRGDAITSLAPHKSNTTGNANWLGVELDASAFMRSENGFYFELAYGVLFPLKGLDHRKENIPEQFYKNFSKAQIAHTLQGFIGVTF